MSNKEYNEVCAAHLGSIFFWRKCFNSQNTPLKYTTYSFVTALYYFILLYAAL